MRCRAVGLSIGALVFAGACATSTGAARTSEAPLAETPAPAPAPEPYTRTLGRVEIDSLVAQAIADHAGPRVDIRAEVIQTGTSRHLRGAFHVEDDAYVLVGHVDPDGIVRIVFPSDPKDDGFVHGGGRSYETSEFFAGFDDAYRFRYATYGRYRGFQPSAYDGSGGYMFIVASWRPMELAKLATDNAWDSFEIMNPAATDPRSAIFELAALVAGTNREAYTVKFAEYYGTMNYSPGAGASYSAYDLGMCNGYGFLGWAPLFSQQLGSAFYGGDLGSSFFYARGQPYYYDAAAGCAVRVPYAYYGFSPFTPPGTGPGGTPTTPRTHVISMDDTHRKPLEPRPTGGRFVPAGAADAGGSAVAGKVSQQYRQRGLITADDPHPVTQGRARLGVDERTTHSGPSIQEMTQRRFAEPRGTNAARYDGGSGPASGPATSPTATRSAPVDGQRPAPVDVQRTAPVRESPRIESRPSAPPPAPAPAPAPAASSSSSTGKPVP